MGLDVSHDAWSGAYGAFSRWRQQLAEAAGYWVLPVEFPDQVGYRPPTVLIDWGHVTDAQLQGIWGETPSDPLLVLIAHSDCDGVIHPEQAGPLADRIEELMPLLPTEDAPGHIGNWQDKTAKFVAGLRAAAAAGETVEFW